MIDIRGSDSRMRSRVGERVGEGIESVDVNIVVNVSVSVRIGERCVVISFVRPPSVLRILSRSSYSLLGPSFLVIHVPSWRPVSCALEIASFKILTFRYWVPIPSATCREDSK